MARKVSARTCDTRRSTCRSDIDDRFSSISWIHGSSDDRRNATELLLSASGGNASQAANCRTKDGPGLVSSMGTKPLAFGAPIAYLGAYTHIMPVFVEELGRMTTNRLQVSPAPEPGAAQRIISRSALRDGSFLSRVRATPGLTVRTDAELEASLTEILEARPTASPIWVFGYGSLMWNPAFDFAERRIGTLRGWHRRFCLKMTIGLAPRNVQRRLSRALGGSAHAQWRRASNHVCRQSREQQLRARLGCSKGRGADLSRSWRPGHLSGIPPRGKGPPCGARNTRSRPRSSLASGDPPP